MITGRGERHAKDHFAFCWHFHGKLESGVCVLELLCCLSLWRILVSPSFSPVSHISWAKLSVPQKFHRVPSLNVLPQRNTFMQLNLVCCDEWLNRLHLKSWLVLTHHECSEFSYLYIKFIQQRFSLARHWYYQGEWNSQRAHSLARKIPLPTEFTIEELNMPAKVCPVCRGVFRIGEMPQSTNPQSNIRFNFLGNMWYFEVIWDIPLASLRVKCDPSSPAFPLNSSV